MIQTKPATDRAIAIPDTGQPVSDSIFRAYDIPASWARP
jgi:hypothetical protein